MSQSDLFGQPEKPADPVEPAGIPTNPFPSIAAAHAWMDRNGWKPRLDGGYEINGRGYGALTTELRLEIRGR